ncbi:MAG: Na-K-Cl cotransporter, partial [Thermoplasmatota archaeon]
MVEGSISQERKLGMISGVFVPTLLTILGVIMFLRLGWVVGNVGLLGAWSIIGLAFFITGITALSMSSIITNMKIGAGGAYSIIARSLGLEVGGSIGVPLYLSLSLSMVMYIFGFRAGIMMIFPQYSSLLIDFAVFGVLFLLVFLSTSFAFKIQYVILAVVIGSIISVLATGINFDIAYNFTEPKATGSFWTVFAVFFPAATGIMAGANMSG